MLRSLLLLLQLWWALVLTRLSHEVRGAAPTLTSGASNRRQSKQNNILNHRGIDTTIGGHGGRLAESQSQLSKEERVWDPTTRDLKMCSPLGGVDLVRLQSSHTRALFQAGIDDAELTRAYFNEAMLNGGLAGTLSNLTNLEQSLDWQARGSPPNSTTLSAGLGWVDDRSDRCVE